jgi:mono/diheme cytochrome c family protein/uncharacterized membrane protein
MQGWQNARRCHCAVYRCVLAGLLFLASLGAQQFGAPTAVCAQAGSPKSSQRPAAQPSAPAAAGSAAGRELFHQHCVKCHGADGKGSAARSLMPEIPDFTAASWQKGRSDAQLKVSILDGKGTGMPAASGKISAEQAGNLVAHVRAFGPNTEKSGKKPQEPASDDFDLSFRRLEEQLHELQKQSRELSKLSPQAAPSKPSESSQDKVADPSAPNAKGKQAVRELFRQHCVKCHGADGTGSQARDRLPKIPNFIDLSWQKKRNDGQLLTSILDGKEPDMPPVREKISVQEARGLVAHVRAFAPGAAKPGQGDQEAPPKLNERYHRLQQQLDELRRQISDLSRCSSGAVPSRPSETQQSKGTQASVPAAARTPTVRELFRQHCVKCHGADGTGSPVRGRLPKIPDFTAASWQAQRRDAQLLTSILNGKGKDMPPARAKISDEQAGALVAYVRAFAPTREESAQAEPERPAPGEPAEVKAPRGFLVTLIRWLGTFHPAAVHFPIALLTAGAVSELLRMGTGKLAFDFVSRYCVWFGALSAAAAGILGWFVGSFRLAGASWLMITHAWLGTSTVVCAGLVLALSEASFRSDRHRVQMWFRVMLLVLAVLVMVTGFFGGAVVFGPEHYSWPH